MEQQKVDMFIMMNNKYLPESQIPSLRQRLLECDEDKASLRLIRYEETKLSSMVSSGSRLYLLQMSKYVCCPLLSCLPLLSCVGASLSEY